MTTQETPAADTRSTQEQADLAQFVHAEVDEYAPEAVRRAIGEVGPDALARIAHAHQAGHVYEALWNLMRDVSWVGKTEKMTQGAGGNYDFRSIEQVIAALGSRARVHGLALQSRHVAGPEYVEHEVEKANGKGSTRWTTCRGLVVEYSWTSLRDGTTMSMIGVGEGRDSSDKATNKAMTAAYKYALTQATMLPTFDPDPDGARPEVESGGDQQGPPPHRGDDPVDQTPQADPEPPDILAAIRQATDLDTLTGIREWLQARDALAVEIDGQAFGQHLEAARLIVAPEGGGQGG